MRHYFQALATLLVFICVALASNAAEDDFSKIMENIREDVASNPTAARVDADLKSFNASSGAFSDIDYSNRGVTTWTPISHIDRLTELAYAYTNPQNQYYGDENLYNKIVKGLQYWQDRNPESDNWWHNQIAEPQKMGILLIQMRAGKKKLPSDLEKKILQRIEKDGGDPTKYTGANATDIALHWIYRACLQGNKSDLQKALNCVYSTIAYTTEEGFQYDNSFCQHGKQLYIGGYGDTIMRGITQVLVYTRGTSYSISEDKLDIVKKFLFDTYYPCIRGQYMMYDVMGREVSRPDATKKTSSSIYAERMEVIDSENATTYKGIANRVEGKAAAKFNVTPMHNHYYCSDYTLHVRPNYTFDVRLVSTRTMRCEYGNNENIKTYFLSDGCNNIAVTGKEYVDIFPMWDWARIPGTTAPQLKKIPLAATEWQTPGTATFAGGVSDGTYGATAYAYNDTYSGINTGGHKGWFFFDDEVVCLGAGINSSNNADINTTINQCLSSESSKVYVSAGGQTSQITAASSVQHSPDWILHESVAYIFPNGGDIFVEKEQKKANWQEINPPTASKEQTGVVFTIGINHGKKPKNASYAYIVLCGKSSTNEVKTYYSKDNIEIASNEANLQAVRHKGLGIWEFIFYEAGTFKHADMTLTVDHPCAVLVEEKADKMVELHVADPAQTEKNIKVNITCPNLFSGEKTAEFQFAGKGVYAGTTISQTIK